MPSYRHGVKKRLYLQHPEPDIAIVRNSITTFIPPIEKKKEAPKPEKPKLEAPPPKQEKPPPALPAPPPRVEQPPPPPPPVLLPAPPPPPPKVEIDVISVDVDPTPRRRSRRRHRPRTRTPSPEREVVIERDHYIPVPYAVDTGPQYETFRYVEGPPRRQYSPSPPPQPRRRMIANDEWERIRVEDRERTRYW